MEERLKIGYISFSFFMIVLATSLILYGKFGVKVPPIQTILIFIAIVIMLISRARIEDLLAGVILHPIMAMTSGFLIAGALGLAGGFDALLDLCWKIAHFVDAIFIPLQGLGISFLGLKEGISIGLPFVAVILVNIPTITPMPCGRILAAALIPGVYYFAKAIAEVTNNPVALPILIGAFIVNAAASCGPSPLGGVGGIGEGNLGVEIGSSGPSQETGILIATGITALVVSLITGKALVPYLR
ncbi:MAG: hypothetical protein ACE5K4_11475 [Candidatus Hydrothermarchaeota archaeon]